MPLVHELKFGAINQLSVYKSIQVYTFTKRFYIKGGLCPLICCKFSKMYKALNIITSRFHCSKFETHV